MSGQDFVRAARESDAAAVARIQVECWRTDYAGIIPDEVLAELTSEESAGRWQERWAEALHVERVHGAGASRFVAERIGALALNDDSAGVERWRQIARHLQTLQVGKSPIQ